MADLLFEIGTEELPAGFILPALEQLQQNFIRKATELQLGFGQVKVAGTPRRLALIVQDLRRAAAGSPGRASGTFCQSRS